MDNENNKICHPPMHFFKSFDGRVDDNFSFCDGSRCHLLMQSCKSFDSRVDDNSSFRGDGSRCRYVDNGCDEDERVVVNDFFKHSNRFKLKNASGKQCVQCETITLTIFVDFGCCRF